VSATLAISPQRLSYVRAAEVSVSRTVTRYATFDSAP
jgi:hypothetical protein